MIRKKYLDVVIPSKDIGKVSEELVLEVEREKEEDEDDRKKDRKKKNVKGRTNKSNFSQFRNKSY